MLEGRGRGKDERVKRKRGNRQVGTPVICPSTLNVQPLLKLDLDSGKITLHPPSSVHFFSPNRVWSGPVNYDSGVYGTI